MMSLQVCPFDSSFLCVSLFDANISDSDTGVFVVNYKFFYFRESMKIESDLSKQQNKFACDLM